jgi:hypothetical protein
MTMSTVLQTTLMTAFINDFGDAAGSGIGDGSATLMGGATELITWNITSGDLSVNGSQQVTGSAFGSATAGAGSNTTIDGIRYKFQNGTTAWDDPDVSGVAVTDSDGNPVTAITAGQVYNLNTLTINPPNDA